MKIAIYGGSFNPPHVGHQMTIAYVLATQAVDEVWVCPVFNHPDGKKLVDFHQRMDMCHEMTAIFDRRKVAVKEHERVVFERFGSGLTINMCRHLISEHTKHKFLLVLGYDILPSFEKWQGYPELAELRASGKIDFFFVGRTGHGNSPVEMPRISSSEIRQMLLSSGEMNEGLLSGMLPRDVRSYIKDKNLYRL